MTQSGVNHRHNPQALTGLPAFGPGAARCAPPNAAAIAKRSKSPA
jgi:hypothetical protein